MINKDKLLDKSEAMTLLCTKASSYWSMIKFCFNIPMVMTSSAMCIINSISQDANEIKIPNIVVNACSVLIMSLLNNIKPSEKFELFKKLSQQYMLLSQEIEMLEDSDEEYKNKINILSMKFDNLIQDTSFEEIPSNFKKNVANMYYDANRYVPIQLNGIIGNMSSVKKRSSKELNINIGTLSEVV